LAASATNTKRRAMTEPEFDRDGYPTDRTLEAIEKWDSSDFRGLMKFVADAWKYPECAYPKENDDEIEYHFATGGWSGNESLISSIRSNTIFFMCCWKMSERGGKHVYSKRKIKIHHKEHEKEGE